MHRHRQSVSLSADCFLLTTVEQSFAVHVRVDLDRTEEEGVEALVGHVLVDQDLLLPLDAAP